MKEKIAEAFEALKQLDIKATPNNVSILDGVYDVLRIIYNELGGAEDGRSTPASDGRDND